MPENIELKARCRDLAAACAAAQALGAAPAQVERQTDTYFRVARGRLKLREIAGGRAELVFYERPDAREARLSRYRVVPVADPAPLKEALASALGVRGVVAKRREVLLLGNVRIHLDVVDSLGTFVEFEAVLGGGRGEAESRAVVARLRDALGISASDLVASSYLELLG